jgi:ABC-type transport system involved in cytochrome bd biosynthesis fused ATPase/permease subunit
LSTTNDEVDLPVGGLKHTIGVAPFWWRWWRVFLAVVVVVVVILATTIITSVVTPVVATIIAVVFMMIVTTVVVTSVITTISIEWQDAVATGRRLWRTTVTRGRLSSM